MYSDYQFKLSDCNGIIASDLQTNDFEILEFSEKSVDDSVIGIMGGHYKIYIKVKLNNKISTRSYFVKRMRSPHAIQTELIKATGAYKKEYFSYMTLTKLYEKQLGYVCDYMAKCRFTVDNELFVFQDVSELGYSVQKNVDYLLDENHLKVALKALAKFHAGSIIYETQQRKIKGERYKIIDDYSEYFLDSLYRKDPNYLGNIFYKTGAASIVALIDVIPHFHDKKQIKQRFLEEMDRVYDLVKPSDTFLNVVCHGDLWNSNISFKYVDNIPVHCKFLDFQAIRYTVPAHDYLYLVNTNGVEFDGKSNVFSKYYYDSLQNYLKEFNIDLNTLMTYEAFLDSINYVFPFVVVQSAGFSTLCIVRYDQNVANNEELFKKCLYDDRSEICVKAYQENKVFREIIDELTKDVQKL